MKCDYDLFVIGAGSGGVRASRVSAGYGAKVAVAECGPLGGTCVNVGCVPKKLMVYASHFHEDFQDAAAYGWTVPEPRFHWPTLIANKDREIARLNAVYGRLLDAAGVEVLHGRASFIDDHTLQIGSRRVRAERVLVATGGRPSLPAIPGIEHAVTSDQMFYLDDLPERAVVVGGGFIAVEFAGILAGMGTEVTQLYRGEQILRGFDDDVRHTLAAQMRAKGIDLRVGVNVSAIERDGPQRRLTLTDGTTSSASCVLFATGRTPNTAGLGLAASGVRTGPKGAIVVDRHSQSSVPHIHAIGDVTDRVNLTPVAIMEAMAFAKTVFGATPTPVDHSNVAAAVFSQPPVGCVGLTEAQARARHGDVDVYRSSFGPLKHTLTGRGEKSMMKLVVEPASDRVLGAHMVGPDAGEIIQGIAIAIKMGATKAQFDATVGIHPTTAEEFVTMREKVAPMPAAAD